MLSNYNEWVQEGINKGYCSPVYCETHQSIHNDDQKEYENLLQEYGERDFCWLVVHIKGANA
jgi:hypothetical protein